MSSVNKQASSTPQQGLPFLNSLPLMLSNVFFHLLNDHPFAGGGGGGGGQVKERKEEKRGEERRLRLSTYF